MLCHTLDAAGTRFLQSCPPGLPDGSYRLTARLDVRVKGEARAYEAALSFSAHNLRRTLPADTVYAVYPPAGSEGDYARTLPHAVLTPCALPWLTLPQGMRSSGNAPLPDLTPWLALLLLRADEPCALKTMPLSDYLTGGEGIFPSGLPSETGEDIRVAELPARLFDQIAPYGAELPLLCHAREVPSGDKEDGALDTPGRYAVVVSNRLPAEEGDYLALLVGLGDAAALLEDGPGRRREGLVRLPVLKDWTFVTHRDAPSPHALFERLETGPLRAPAGGSGAAERALEQGYVPLRAWLRSGEESVRWYRGPLAPDRVAHSGPAEYANADSALFYSPATGLFDDSYAAAWQLGRMLALAHPPLCRALMKCRDANLRAAENARFRAALSPTVDAALSPLSRACGGMSEDGSLTARMLELTHTLLFRLDPAVSGLFFAAGSELEREEEPE